MSPRIKAKIILRFTARLTETGKQTNRKGEFGRKRMSFISHFEFVVMMKHSNRIILAGN